MDEYRTLPTQQGPSVPRILLTATTRWSLGARVASGFLDLGCRVAAVCPIEGHPIRKVSGLDNLFAYAARSPLESLLGAIEQFEPDVVVPLCDRSVRHLHQLHARFREKGEFGRRILELIERSLGPASSFSVTSSRYDLMIFAKEAGIRIPATIRIDSRDDLTQWKDRLPCMMKADGTSCGLGVKKLESLTSGTKALRQFKGGLSAFELIRRLLLYRDRALTISTWNEPSPGVIAQAIVRGKPANCSVVCWKGKLLSGIAVEVAQTDGPFEPAIVVDVVEGGEMLEAARRIARKLQLSGFFGLDFMIEEGTRIPYLIEMNPRCTPPCSVVLDGCRDLLAAFVSELGFSTKPRPAVTQLMRIAYYPITVMRGIVSSEINQSDSAYLDFPHGQPELAYDLVHPWSELSRAGRLLHQVRRALPFKKQIRRILSSFQKSPNADRTDTVTRVNEDWGICTQNDRRG